MYTFNVVLFAELVVSHWVVYLVSDLLSTPLASKLSVIAVLYLHLRVQAPTS